MIDWLDWPKVETIAVGPEDVGPLGLFLPKVEKSKSSGLSVVSPVFSKKFLSSFLDLNLFCVGPMMKTSYLPADAPLFLCDTFLCHPCGSVSSSNKGVLLGSGIGRGLTGGRGDDF